MVANGAHRPLQARRQAQSYDHGQKRSGQPRPGHDPVHQLLAQEQHQRWDGGVQGDHGQDCHKAPRRSQPTKANARKDVLDQAAAIDWRVVGHVSSSLGVEPLRTTMRS